MRSAAREQARADSIPRYAEQGHETHGQEEPSGGRCRNCWHRTAIAIEGRKHHLCAQERDDGATNGELHVCDPEVTDCSDWVWDGYEL